MNGLTASQKDELIILRRQSSLVQENIETLKKCEISMTAIRREVQIQTSNFQKNSPHDRSYWRGSRSVNYSNDSDAIKSFSTSYHEELGAIINRVSREIAKLSSDLTNINSTIGELQLIANGGL